MKADKRVIDLEELTYKVNLDEHEAAAKYGPSIYWFRRARCVGGGPRYIKLSGRVLYKDTDLQSFFDSKVRANTAG